jgi:hypothetical protein
MLDKNILDKIGERVISTHESKDGTDIVFTQAEMDREYLYTAVLEMIKDGVVETVLRDLVGQFADPNASSSVG